MTLAILTDSSAIFPHATFTGQSLVKVLSIDDAAGADSAPHAAFPAPEHFLGRYHQLGRDYDHILVTVISAGLAPVLPAATEALRRYPGRARVSVFDSQSAGVGLGYLVEMAAAAAQAGESVHDIENELRAAVPHIFTLFGIPNLGRLAAAGFISPAQSIVGDMLGIVPLFMLEAGRLSPLQKVRTSRHLIESLQEFMEEFSAPQHIAVMRAARNRTRTRPLRQFAAGLFPATQFTEHSLPAPLVHLFGNDAMGLALMDET